MKPSKLRVIVPSVVLLIVAVAYVAHIDVGTLSTFGWSTISLICPLGALSTLLATKTVVVHVLVALGVGIVLLVVFGRALCGWVCPVPIVSKLRTLFSREPSHPKDAQKKGEADEQHIVQLADEERALIAGVGCTACGKKRGGVVDSRHIVLGGSLLTAAIFGFPVFCLICPVGLSFATIFLVINLFGMGDLTWSVVIVPALLLIEVVFFRKWCSTFCPLSALASLLTKAGRFFRPKIDDTVCLEVTSGVSCGLCGKVCPERIDPRHPELSEASVSECTKCLACVENCPTGAIKLPLWAGASDKRQTSSLPDSSELSDRR